jgi:hypothetical protein
LLENGMASILAVFDDEITARRAAETAKMIGIPDELLTVSAPLTTDGIAAEAPGQSYGNQPGQPDSKSRPEGSYADAVRAGGCVVTVKIVAGSDVGLVRDVLRKGGARYLDYR